AYSQGTSLSLEAELARKKAKLADLSTRYTEMVPEVMRAKQDVEELEARIEERRRSASAKTARGKKEERDALEADLSSAGIDEIRRTGTQLKILTMEIASLKKEKEGIQKNIAAAEQKINQSPRREQEMIALVRDYENQKSSYDDLLKKKLQADVSQNLEKRQKGTQFQILDPANLPEAPIKPNRRRVMGISLVLALFLGFGGAIGWEAMDPQLRDVRDFRHLYKVPILGYIPVHNDQQAQRGHVLRRAAVFGGLITFSMAFSAFLLVYREKIRTILNF
ncbi:MAG: chain-length determining protein, partial [Deltaproteobacteria bacterium]|nr:chain-length determining protein [Deltaproteobacteria bacterium]